MGQKRGLRAQVRNMVGLDGEDQQPGKADDAEAEYQHGDQHFQHREATLAWVGAAKSHGEGAGQPAGVVALVICCKLPDADICR